MVQLPSKSFVVLAAFAAAATVTAARAQTSSRPPQWPLTLQDAQVAKAGQPAGPQSGQTAPAQPAPADSAQASPAPAQPAETGWTENEIATARARCNAIIARYDVSAEPMDPLRDGDCGSPHPVQLTRIGSVTMSQPATVNCEVIAALGDWLKVDVQPAARQLLGSRVTSIEVLSSYSCRNAYGRKRSRMSEHGRANALDIKSFHLEKQQASVDLLADWGMTDRDIRARIAAAEAAAKAQAAARAKAEAEAQALAQARAKARQQGNSDTTVVSRGSVPLPTSEGFTALRGMVPDLGKSEEESSPSTLSLGQPSRLGGPKAKATEPPAVAAAAPVAAPSVEGAAISDGRSYTARQRFLRQIHAAACKRFGTVLGPEANDAHRNHFHLDMADRGGRGSYCE